MNIQFITQLILAIIFLILSSWHIYWLIGGRKGLKTAVPEVESGKPAFVPGRLATAVVGFGLLSLCILVLVRAGLFGDVLELSVANILCRIFAVIFTARAIGDFKYVGFFKKVKTSQFAKWDSKLFSPLCVIIAIIFLIEPK